jgi:hypothetical protein
MQTCRERIETLEQDMRVLRAQTSILESHLRWWRGMAGGLGLLALVSLPLQSGTAAAPPQSQGTAARLAALEQKLAAVTFDAAANELVITGVNLHIVNGLGTTQTANGLGNLLVGYNEARGGGFDLRTGSHNLIVGQEHNFSSYGGLVIGERNGISGPFAAVSGGHSNAASGANASVTAGFANEATGEESSVTGGTANRAFAPDSSVSGGHDNEATGNTAWVGGGAENNASGICAAVSGGSMNVASGAESTVSGGAENTASGNAASVSGGGVNTASGQGAVVSGGSHNTAAGTVSTVSGGDNRSAPAEFNWVAGTLFANQ